MCSFVISITINVLRRLDSIPSHEVFQAHAAIIVQVPILDVSLDDSGNNLVHQGSGDIIGWIIMGFDKCRARYLGLDLH